MWDVSISIFIFFVSSEALSFLQTSRPSILGIERSSNIKSGVSVFKFVDPCNAVVCPEVVEILLEQIGFYCAKIISSNSRNRARGLPQTRFFFIKKIQRHFFRYDGLPVFELFNLSTSDIINSFVEMSNNMKSIKYMDSSETVSNYRNIGSPHIGTYKLNGLTALVFHIPRLEEKKGSSPL